MSTNKVVFEDLMIVWNYKNSLVSIRYIVAFPRKIIVKCIAIMQAASGILEDFVKNNEKMISESGHVVESTIVQTYVT